jgi:outer membrane protein
MMGYVKQLRAGSLLRIGMVLAAGMLAAQAASAEVKIGFVNRARVVELAPQAEAARNRIEREFAPKDRELLQQQKDVRGLEDRLVKNAAVLSEAERQKQENEIRASKRELRRAQDEFREDLNLRRSQELSKLQQKVIEVIQAFAEAEKYDLIVSEGVIFAGKRVDITDMILERLRADFKKSSQ